MIEDEIISMPAESRFRGLLAEKEQGERRHTPLTEVADKTNLTWKTLQGWANNTITRDDAPVIEALCKYLELEVGDLLIIANS